MSEDRFVIIGAGPAGLSAAYELTRHGLAPIVLEKDSVVGGIARTETYKGYYFDKSERIDGTKFITSMPLTELIRKLDPPAPAPVLEAAAKLRYRDFLTVCLIVNRAELFPDDWIYIQDPAVKGGRIQNFKNWSPEMVADATRTSLGLEYFCTEGDALWTMSDADLVELGKRELGRIGLARYEEVEDGCVFRVPKSYPLYDGEYADHLRVVRGFIADMEYHERVTEPGRHRESVELRECHRQLFLLELLIRRHRPPALRQFLEII